MQIDIIGDIGGEVRLQGLQEQLMLAEGQDIDLYINSGGGSILEGIAIYNALRNYPGRIEADIDFAASMATYIAMAADHLRMSDNGWFMIHNPASIVAGEADEMRRAADLMDKMKADFLTRYSAKTNIDHDRLSEMMDDETWMNAQEAFEMGFVDELTGDTELAANFNGEIEEKFNLVASATINKQKEPETMAEENKEEALSIFNKLGVTLGLIKAETAESNDGADAEQIALEPETEQTIEFNTEAIEASITESVQAKLNAEFEAKFQALEAKEKELEKREEEADAKLVQAEEITEEATEKVEAAEARLSDLDAGFVAEAGEQINHAEKYDSLEGREKNAYFKAHEQDIISAKQK